MILGRTLAGGLAGGILGYGNTGTQQGFLGGAAAGAAVGAMGPMAAKRFMPGRTVAGTLAGGLGMGISGVAGLGGRLGKMTANTRLGGMGLQYGMAGIAGAARGLGAAQGFIGRNTVAVNKWGGRALMGLGVAAGAHLGSSVLSSNRRY